MICTNLVLSHNVREQSLLVLYKWVECKMSICENETEPKKKIDFFRKKIDNLKFFFE